MFFLNEHLPAILDSMLLSLVQKSFTLMQCNLDLVNEVPILVVIFQNIAISYEFRPVCNFAVLCSIKNE